MNPTLTLTRIVVDAARTDRTHLAYIDGRWFVCCRTEDGFEWARGKYYDDRTNEPIAALYELPEVEP